MNSSSQQALPGFELENALDSIRNDLSNGQINKILPEDETIHQWYRFVLSFPPHLVRSYLEDFGLLGNGGKDSVTILDPFCGTGTTIVEAKLNNVRAIGVEANPFAHFASKIKTDWSIDPDKLLSVSKQIANKTIAILEEQSIDDNVIFHGEIDKENLRTLDAENARLLIKNSISSLPLHKTLTLLDVMEEYSQTPFYNHGLLALANALVYQISNLRFGPEVGVGKIKEDAPVVRNWLVEIERIVSDLQKVRNIDYSQTEVLLADSRKLSKVLKTESIDAVITSPPYPNEKDYSRTTRLESVILGFVNDRKELRRLKKTFVRSNTRGVYKDDKDDVWVSDNENVIEIAEAIEKKRIELGKTSGFEKLYSRVTKQYFGGMARHLADLRPALRKNAKLAYVVGDQASYLKVKIRTGNIIAQIAESLGYEVERIDLFRTRFATATKEELNEEVVILHWPG